MGSEMGSWLIRIVDDQFTDAIQDDVTKLAMDMTMEFSGIQHSLEGSPAIGREPCSLRALARQGRCSSWDRSLWPAVLK